MKKKIFYRSCFSTAGNVDQASGGMEVPDRGIARETEETAGRAVVDVTHSEEEQADGDEAEARAPDVPMDVADVEHPSISRAANNYTIVSDSCKTITKFNYSGRCVCVKFEEPPVNLSLEEVLDYIKKYF